MKKPTYSVVCPFCNTVHQRTSAYLNVICACGGKYYPCSGKWINRKTGEHVEGLANNICDCKACPQRRLNHKETGWKCISYAYAVNTLKNLVDCVDSLSDEQKNAIAVTIETVKEQEKLLEMEGVMRSESCSL